MSGLTPVREADPSSLRRVLIIGTSCAGKSTLGSEAGRILGVPHTELDSLHWGAEWTPVPVDVFRERVATVTARDRWVIDGNYHAVRDLIWPEATCIVWLDYSFPLVLWRSVYRSWRRIFRGETCCNGNRETLRLLLSGDSIIWWVITTYHQRRREFSEILPQWAQQGRVIRVFRRPSEATQWLESLPAGRDRFERSTPRQDQGRDESEQR